MQVPQTPKVQPYQTLTQLDVPQTPTPKVQPNQTLIKCLEMMLAKVRAGLIHDGVVIGIGYDGSGRQEWFHHYSIEREDDVPIMIGELDLFKDVLKANVHNARNKAATVGKLKDMSGVS